MLRARTYIRSTLRPSDLRYTIDTVHHMLVSFCKHNKIRQSYLISFPHIKYSTGG